MDDADGTTHILHFNVGVFVNERVERHLHGLGEAVELFDRIVVDALSLILKIVSKAEAWASFAFFGPWVNGECHFFAVAFYSDVDATVAMLT